jgi:DNA polymerase-3 subunit epsilon
MSIREIVLDTETTGLDPKSGHRVVEIGAVELINHVATGAHYHTYINPDREVDQGAFEVHGLSTEFLSEHPKFEAVVDDFLIFIADDALVIHNARFDMGFLNAELERAKYPVIPIERAIDTLGMARRKFPGAQASLDALCRRYEIDNGHRDLHGALVDANLLASVYLELIGGRQPGFEMSADAKGAVAEEIAADAATDRPRRSFPPSPAELEAHEKFLEQIKAPLWRATKSD